MLHTDDEQFAGPYDMERWIPVRPILASRPGQWNGIDLTAQYHAAWSGHVPPLRSHLVSAFLKPVGVRRRIAGPWHDRNLDAGDILFVPRATGSQWEWNGQLHNIHLFIADDYFARVAAAVYGKSSDRIELVDRLSIRDKVIVSTLELLAHEVARGGVGEQLYADALATQLCVHLLRHYTTFDSLEPSRATTLDGEAANRVRNHIEEHLAERLDIATLARIARQSPYHFIRVFKRYFEMTPHEYVMIRRLERARSMIEQQNLPLKRIAAECGFCDQSHMSRLFKARFGETPGKFATV